MSDPERGEPGFGELLAASVRLCAMVAVLALLAWLVWRGLVVLFPDTSWLRTVSYGVVPKPPLFAR